MWRCFSKNVVKVVFLRKLGAIKNVKLFFKNMIQMWYKKYNKNRIFGKNNVELIFKKIIMLGAIEMYSA